MLLQQPINKPNQLKTQLGKAMFTYIYNFTSAYLAGSIRRPAG